MKRFPKILAAGLAALTLSSSLALAAEPAKKDKPAPEAAAAPMAHGGMMGGGMMGGGMMGLAALPPEKQAVAHALMAEHSKALFPLHQSLYAKNAELEALLAAGNGESDKARAVIRDIADLNAKMLAENARFRTRMIKETGLRAPVMGHGGMMGGGMMGGMMGGMKGGMACPMMSGMHGDMKGDMPGDMKGDKMGDMKGDKMGAMPGM